jgi:hypothetical protein
MNLFGFSFKKQESTFASPQTTIPIPRAPEDGEIVISAGGFQGQYLAGIGETFSGMTESELILNYRSAAEQPECDSAISDIVDEAIAAGGKQVTLDMDRAEFLSEDVKQKIHDEFRKVTSLLDFNATATDIFRRWYVDGRLFYHIVIDKNNTKSGIAEMRPIDPLRIRKIREVKTDLENGSRTPIERIVDEYYVYSDSYAPQAGSSILNVQSGTNAGGLKIAVDSVVYVTSGLMDPTRRRVLSYLQKALKPLNQLRMMEDALVIYRITRAPERRIFYVDVGNLPKGKAEEYVQGIMNKYRNKAVYDSASGEVRDDRRHMSMLEDFWLPRREGGKGTEITTLPGGSNLSEISDVQFFQKKFHRSLNVPESRSSSESTYSYGKDNTEIAREEVRFQKFIDKLRKKFSQLLLDTLKVQLVLRNVITIEEWPKIVETLTVDFGRDNYFVELKEAEILKKRMETLDSIDPRVGIYFSKNWVRRNILKQTDEEIKIMDDEINMEKNTGEIADTGPLNAEDNPPEETPPEVEVVDTNPEVNEPENVTQDDTAQPMQRI